MDSAIAPALPPTSPARCTHVRSKHRRRWCAAVAMAVTIIPCSSAYALNYATCISGPIPAVATFTLPAGTYAVPRNTPSGTMIVPWQSFQRFADMWQCQMNGSGLYNFMGPVYQNTGLAWSGQNYSDPSGQTFPIYKTNLDNIGIIIGVSSWRPDTHTWLDQNGYPRGIPLGASGYVTAGTYANTGTPTVPFGVSAAIAYVKYGDGAASPGIVTGPGTFGTTGMADRPIASVERTASLALAGSTTFIVLACTTPDITVNLGPHLAGGFTGSGTRVGARDFDINVNACPAGMNAVRYRLDPASGIIDASQAVVGLTSDSTATGMGVQVTDRNNVPVTFGVLRATTGYNPASGGSFTIPLRASYYQTAATVNPGRADSAVVFTMSYE